MWKISKTLAMRFLFGVENPGLDRLISRESVATEKRNKSKIYLYLQNNGY